MGQHIQLSALTEWWSEHRPQRIMVVGSSGSGKSTLGQFLGTLFPFPVIDLDNLHWLPNWQPSELEEFRQRVREAVAPNEWILAGNYGGKAQDLILPRADVIIWLNFPLLLVFWRIIKRCLYRIFTQETVCNGNRESIVTTFFSKDSLLLWVLKMHTPQRQRYRNYLEDSSKPPMLILLSPIEISRFQNDLKKMCHQLEADS